MTAVKNDHRKLKIDPRIRERHNKVVRSTGRKRLYVILFVFLGLICIYGARMILRTSLFSLKRFDVIGSTHYSSSTILAASGIKLGLPLTEINSAKVAKSLEAMPWNGPVQVKKKWPNTLVVSVAGRVPLAVLASTANSDLLVDSTGRVLSVEKSTALNNWIHLCWLPSITSSNSLKSTTGCVQQNNQPGSFIAAHYQRLLKVVQDLRSAKTIDITEIATSPTGEIDGELSNGIAVRFGGASQMAAKLRSLNLVLKNASMSGYTTIDVRDPQEPVLSKW